MGSLAGNAVGPGHFFRSIKGMPVQSAGRIIGAGRNNQELVDNIAEILRPVIPQGILCIKGCSHVEPVKPHLVRINFFVPESAFSNAWL